MRAEIKWQILAGLAVALFLGALWLNIGRTTPAPHLDDLDSGGGRDALYALALAAAALFTAAGLGRLLLKPFDLGGWTFVERSVLSLPMGLAVIGLGEFALGLIGVIQPVHHLLWLTALTVIAFKPGADFLAEAWGALKAFRGAWRGFSPLMKVFFIAGALALTLAFVQALTPPWSYDALMYHLQGPRLFLEAGRVLPIPENWFTYYPALWEMIYMLGMGLGSDVFARLIHFATLLLLILATYAFGRRFLPPPGGWLAAAMMVGVPVMLVWGGFAYIDLAWALFQFLAIALVLIWQGDRRVKYLLLAGVIQGLALGTKYTAFSGAGVLGLAILWLSAREKDSPTRWKETLHNALAFGLPALLAAMPWYLKNLIWTGNPVFPFFFPQNVIDPRELELWLAYVNSFGIGDRWFDYLLLPFTIFLRFEKFTTVMGKMDIPNPAFLIVFAYPWARRKLQQGARPAMDLLLTLTGLQYVFWAAGSLQTRFLTPLYPGLSLLAAAVIVGLSAGARPIRWGRVLSIGLVGGMVIASLGMMIEYFYLVKPYQVLIGNEIKTEFLTKTVVDYPGIEFINTMLPVNSKVLTAWNGRLYYCDGKCYPDMSHSKWVVVIEDSQNISEINQWLYDNNFTHLYFSWEDIYFIADHDPLQVHIEKIKFVVDEYIPKCTTKVYAKDFLRIHIINFGKRGCN